MKLPVRVLGLLLGLNAVSSSCATPTTPTPATPSAAFLFTVTGAQSCTNAGISRPNAFPLAAPQTIGGSQVFTLSENDTWLSAAAVISGVQDFVVRMSATGNVVTGVAQGSILYRHSTDEVYTIDGTLDTEPGSPPHGLLNGRIAWRFTTLDSAAQCVAPDHQWSLTPIS